MTEEFIEVHGARENNLKDVSLDIPKRKITVFTGVSGSGKSSLVFDRSMSWTSRPPGCTCRTSDGSWESSTASSTARTPSS